MALNGVGLTVDVSNNTVTGKGATGKTGQNGIQVGFGATGSITGNAVSGIAYTKGGFLASAILGFQASGTLTVAQNSIENSQGGLMFADNSANVTENTVSNPETVGFGSIAALLDPGGVEDIPELTPYGSASKRSHPAKSASFSFAFNDNQLTGSDESSSYGVYVYSGLYGSGETLSVTGSGNLVKDFGYGVVVGESNSGLIQSVVFTENCIISNKIAGLYNLAAITVDATDNWWGSAGGPGHDGANGVFGPVTADPFATDPVAGVEGCGAPTNACPAPDFTETVVSNTPPGEVQIDVTDTDNGIAQVDFYLIDNLTVSSSGFSDGDNDGIWTPDSGTPTAATFTLTQTDSNTPDASYFAKITNGCGTILDVDPPLEFAVTVPDELNLSGNYPNPFGGQTTIEFALPQQADVTLAVYDVTGRQVNVLRSGMMPAGTHQVQWSGRSANGAALASGVYLVRLKAGDQVRTGRLTIVR